jgi:tetratricopeptide (TPR) repeat protein
MAQSCWQRYLFLTVIGIHSWFSGEPATQRWSAAIHSFLLDGNAIEAQQPAEDTPSKLAERGVIAFQQGRFKDAVRYLSAARRADPANPLLAAGLGQALISAGDPTGAIAPLKDALSANPGDDSVRLALAQCYQRLDQDDKVVDLLKPQPSRPSPPPTWLFTLAFSQFRLKQYQDAEVIFRQLVPQPAMTAAASFFVANCRFGQNDLEGSLPWYEGAISAGNSPQNVALNAYYYNYGLALFRLEKYADASVAFLASTTRIPGIRFRPTFSADRRRKGESCKTRF